jgi:hypothetical protein
MFSAAIFVGFSIWLQGTYEKQQNKTEFCCLVSGLRNWKYGVIFCMVLVVRCVEL